ncbi:hypothetical protein [Falsiroseomonas sp.]|uniref:hypothetical protein n=1 Tax=Falsiroseomonas sp. TaxID=2870721 RepID=UPI00271F2CB0|nr:hypothetical protein [Falsiroseomonas sp.]MDO9498795.1 hypothetical protein [Falsiroseomonas sp.]
MRTVSMLGYWLVGLVGTALWTGAIITLTSLPLPTQLALGGMGLVAFIWGHSVLFPKERPAATVTAPGRAPRPEPGRAGMPAGPPSAGPPFGSLLPAGALRMPVTRSPRNAAGLPPPGDLPPLLRTPLEEAARMEAHRLAEVVTASGLAGPVHVRLEADGTALIAPVLPERGVRLPADKLVRFAAYATLPDGLVEAGRHGGGTWSGADLVAAIDAHLATIAPAQAAESRTGASRGAPAPQIRPGSLAAPRLAG